ncbi:MAG: non-ribosomal peptide synthetase, partial [Blastocatellia bacterium]
MAGRSRTELERLIGFFVNTLILKADVDGRGDFQELVHQVREFALAAYSNQDVPFERLVEKLHPRRDMSRNPLFQILMALQSMPAPKDRPIGFQLRAQESDNMTARFDLELQLFENERGFWGTITYATDLYDESTVERLCSHYNTLLDRAAREPLCRIEDLPLMTEAEESQTAGFWLGDKTPTSGMLLHELVERQALRTPDAIAVVNAGELVTYSALDLYAERLANELRGHGAGTESRIGVFVNRGIAMAAALLGVLKAGAAYVPLDPAYPAERLLYIIRECEINILLTDRGLNSITSMREIESIFVEDILRNEGDRGSFQGATAPVHPSLLADPLSLAYVIYTSGSTGLPKGAAIEHRSAVALLEWTHTAFTKEELAAVVASTSICFDLSVFELFAPLSRGGTVIIAENAVQVHELALDHNATLINTVPSVMAELIRASELPRSVMTVNLAGEVLTREMVEQIYGRSNATKIYNLYGPSEDTTYSTFALIERTGADKPVVGRPISNSRAYLTEPGLQPVPVGLVGGIFLGGEGLARGYIGKPELTAEAFLPDPLGGSRGGRIYRTGDLGRFRKDGNLEFLGRADH